MPPSLFLNKYKHLYAEPFPKIFKTNSPITQATYIRDALKYANTNSLPGGHLYKKVVVSPQEYGVVIRLVNDNEVSKILDLPVETLFSLMATYKTLKPGYEFASTTSLVDINNLLVPINFRAILYQNHYLIQKFM
jgi:hypothetical protein